MNKYYLIALLIVVLGCHDKSVEPPNIRYNNSHVIAFDTPGWGVVFIYNSSTKSLVNITEGVVDTSYFARVSSFSDVGNELLYTLDYKKPGKEDWLFCDRDDIFSYNLISGLTTRITDTDFRETNPKYSKDKKTIVYQSFEKGYSEIYLIKQDLDNKNPVFIDTGWYPTFLSDDNQILYSSNPNYNPGFYIYNLKDRTKEKLANINGSQPSVSTDNNFFVYAGSEGIYKYDFTSKEITLLLGGNSGVKMSYEPILSSDAKYIVFKYFDGSWIYNYLMKSDGKDIKNLGKGYDAEFTKDSKYVVSFNLQGIHLIDVNTQADSIIYPYNYNSYNIAVSSIKQ